jgi:hypothetical protein
MSPRAIDNWNKAYRGATMSLLGVCTYFLVKIDQKVDTTYEMVVTQQTRIEVHEEQLKNFRAEINDVKGQITYLIKRQ